VEYACSAAAVHVLPPLDTLDVVAPLLLLSISHLGGVKAVRGWFLWPTAHWLFGGLDIGCTRGAFPPPPSVPDPSLQRARADKWISWRSFIMHWWFSGKIGRCHLKDHLIYECRPAPGSIPGRCIYLPSSPHELGFLLLLSAGILSLDRRSFGVARACSF
jgi:hypothetical protein